MNLQVKKIPLNELEAFVNSKTYRDFDIVPISVIRAKSYLANPNANANDVVLYLGFIDERLVTFRSLFADTVNSGSEQIRFGWCSGTWVHPSFRKKGYSEFLLQEAYTDWNQKLMCTNYTPRSEKLIQKTGWFKAIHQFEGARAYLIPKTRKLVSGSNTNLLSKILFSCIDAMINLFSSLQLSFYRKNESSKYQFKTIQFPDEQCFKAIETKNSFFERGAKELRWIIANPWISTEISEQVEKYPFTSFSKAFSYFTVKVFTENNFIGFFIFSVRDGHLKTLFWNCPKEAEKEIAQYLKHFCKLNNIEMASIYKKGLAAELFKRNFPFLYVKKYGQKIYSTFKLKSTEETNFQDGDGDVIFT